MTTTYKNRPRGEATFDRILGQAVQIASLEGLEAMTIGNLAKAAELSKSGLFSHFKSKQALQLAVIERAAAMFREAVLVPARTAAPGATRLDALVTGWVGASHLFRGGCFFSAAAHELDGRPGPARDRLVAFFHEVEEATHAAVIEAVAEGTIKRNVDFEQLWFDLQGVVLATNFHIQTLAMPKERAVELGVRQARALLSRASP